MPAANYEASTLQVFAAGHSYLSSLLMYARVPGAEMDRLLAKQGQPGHVQAKMSGNRLLSIISQHEHHAV